MTFDIAKEIAKETRAIRREPYAQLDACLMIDKEEIPMTLNIYGERIRGFKGSRETPEEFAGFEIDDVTLDGNPHEVSIYAALTAEDIEILALKVEE